MQRSLITVILFLALAVIAAACSRPASPATTTPTALPTRVAYVPKVAPPSGEVSLPEGGPAQLVVGNTGGDGVWIRRTPAMADHLRTWPDGTPMQVAGPDEQAEGRTFKHVRDPAGNDGWIPAEYLVPQAAAPTARSTGTPQATASEAACLRPSRAFMDHVANGLNFPGGGIAGVQAVQVSAAGDEAWYLVAATIFGSSRGKVADGLWATTIDPTGDLAPGTMVAANSVARELTVWPLPAQGLDRFPPGDPDVQRVAQCLDVALRR